MPDGNDPNVATREIGIKEMTPTTSTTCASNGTSCGHL